VANTLNNSDVYVVTFTVTGADRWFEVVLHGED